MWEGGWKGKIVIGGRKRGRRWCRVGIKWGWVVNGEGSRVGKEMMRRMRRKLKEKIRVSRIGKECLRGWG